MLNSRDVYNIATALNLTHNQVVNMYCDRYIGSDSRIPVLRLKPQGANRVCPLLKNGRCSVHMLKPTVCATFPIGRIFKSENTPAELGLGSPDEVAYFNNGATCGSSKKKQTVRSWLESFGIPTNDHFFFMWNKTAFKLIKIISQYEGKEGITDKAMNTMWNAIFSAFYFDYETSKEFYPQFESNVAKLMSFFVNLSIVSYPQ